MDLTQIIILAIVSAILIKISNSSDKENEYSIEEWHELGLIRERYKSKELNSGFVYFVKDTSNNWYKIGKSNTPETRIFKNFGTLLPEQYKIIHLIESRKPYKTENLFHKYFKHNQYKNELFFLTEQDIKWVKKGKYPRDIEDSIKGY